MSAPSYRLGVDIGGTFTDLLLLQEETGETWRAKVPSTPDDPSVGVIEGKDKILSRIPNGADVVLRIFNHGTTIATNTILEQKGAKVALVVTEGYKDILQTRRSQVPGGLASWIMWPKPEPLAPLELTIEAPGRLATDGSEVRAFDEGIFEERLGRLLDQRPDAVTISLINSFANPEHERKARKFVEKVLPSTPVSISSEVLPELMEYERTITTVVNSYVEPRVFHYLDNLVNLLKGKVKNLRILRPCWWCVELVNLRVVAEETKVDLPVRHLKKAENIDPPASLVASTGVLVFEGKEFTDCPFWDRTSLEQGHRVLGPCVITEMDSNTVILPGFKADIDVFLNILIREVEGNAKPASSEKLDPVTVDIFESALQNARSEMDTLMTRTTMSPAIREQQDEFNVIAEPGGKMIVGQFGSFIPEFLEIWKGSIEPGDIFLTNDPYSVNGAVSHHNDWLIMTPIFVDEKLIAWTANFGHMTDVGGSVPGSLPCAANSIFEEGIQIPVTKVASKGVWNSGLMELIYRNVRLPNWNRSDVRALVAACEMAGKRMVELYIRFGDSIYFATIEELLNRNRRAFASILHSAIPDEPAYFEDWIDDDGQGIGPWKIACKMQKVNGRLSFDFSETDPQSPSSINFYLSVSMFKMFVGIYLLVVYDASVVPNDGFHDVLDVHIPEGCLLRPIRPAAVSCRTHMLGRLMDVLSGLLGQRAPKFMTAAGFSDSPHFMYSGYRDNGDWFQLYWLGFGGIPARPIGDGPDGHCLWPAMKAIPNEFLELYYPLRIEVFDTVADSGGPGLYRGGNAQRIFWRFLAAGDISIHDDRWLSKPWGVLGGEPGARSTKVLVKYSERSEKPRRIAYGSKQDRIKVQKGDVLEWITWGGGGWGDPLEREPSIVALEVARRLVTLEGARLYGVVLRSDGSVDMEETKALRDGMRKKRPDRHESEICNRGGTWEELKANCLEETGLPPPKAPWEIELRGPMTKLPYFEAWKRKQVG